VMKCLFRSPDPDGFTLTYLWFKGNYVLPVHTHNPDCLYCVIAGEIHLGKQVLTSGDGFFVAADTPYGYSVGPQGVEVLEFRNSTEFDITVRDATERAWEKLAGICAENRELW
ncbi:cupin domain-containing protein, partial [Burkholderia sp. SIMBA_019]